MIVDRYCIFQWARDTFEGIFKQSVETAKDYIQNPNFVEETRKLDGSRPVNYFEITIFKYF